VLPAGRARSSFVALALVIAPALMAAQARVALRPLPKPGQVTHVTARQEIVVRIGGKPEEPGPAYLQTNNAITFTQINGTPGPDGKLDARLTLESLELNEQLGGNLRKSPDTSMVKGRIVLVTFNASGSVTGVKIPPDMREVQSRLGQLLTGAYGMINFLPQVELKVGEEASHLTELPMRLPGNLSSGPLQAKTTVTLQQLKTQDNGRTARLQHAIEIDTSTSQMQVSGGGTVDVNVDRGFVSDSTTTWKIAGTMPARKATPPQPFFGTIKLTVSAN
jgi:hypothetical protein